MCEAKYDCFRVFFGGWQVFFFIIFTESLALTVSKYVAKCNNQTH